MMPLILALGVSIASAPASPAVSSTPAALATTLPARTATRPATLPAATSRPHYDERTRRILTGEARLSLPARLMLCMSRAAQRLLKDKDSGPQTQSVQLQILADLDLAIQQAEQNRARSRGGQSGSGGHSGSAGAQSSARSARSGRAGATPAGREDETGGSTAGVRRRAEAADLRRAWGQLPQRQRDELLQGYNEQSLPRYREWIEGYYRALAAPRATATQPGDQP